MRKGLMMLGVFIAGVAFAPIKNTASELSEEQREAMTMVYMFDKIGLRNLGINMHAWFNAFKGYSRLKESGKLTNPRYLSIVDFSQPGGNRRLYILDMNDTCVSFNTYVSHGRNSGDRYATRFSNVENSLMSSLGFFLTGPTYHGQHGLSLRLLGLEKGINDKAEKRGIVMHAADYVSDKVVSNQGHVGRSWGCPAVPTELTEPIIETIKEGTAFFIYHPTAWYQKASKILQGR
jgi:hypothetical protein